MNDLQPDPIAVQAPTGALGWGASRGFIDDTDELLEAHGEGELVLDVTDVLDGRPFGVVADVEGDSPLAVAVRIDRELTELRRAHARLAERVSDVGDKQVGQDTDLAVEVAAIKARVRRLEAAGT